MKLLFLSFISIALMIGCSPKSEKPAILYAKRDAPISGIWLKLSDNQECTIGFYGRSKPFIGTYKFIEDTLLMKFNKKLPPSMDSIMLYRGNCLEYVNNKGSLEIQTNKLNIEFNKVSKNKTK